MLFLGVPARGLLEIVHFGYTGKLRCTLDNISDLLLAATHLQVIEAVELCGRYLINLTDMKNSVDMYNLGEQFNLPSLKSKGMHLILENFEEIAANGDYLRFTEKFLAEILEHNSLCVYSELKLFEYVLGWINHSRGERLKYLYYLMSRVRFPLIPADSFVDAVMSQQLMKNDPQCLELILEANKYHLLPSKQPVMQTLRTQVRNDFPSIVVMDLDDEGPRVYDLASGIWFPTQLGNVDTFHAQVCTLQNYMYVCGGIELFSTNNPVSSKCYRYDPRFDAWCEVAPLQEARHNFTLCSDGKSVFAIGGYCNGMYMDIVEQYMLKHNRWICKTPMSTRLSSAASTVHDGNIFVSGGQNDTGISRHLFCYSIRSDCWKECASMVFPRMDHAMAYHKNHIWVFGGYNKNIVKAFDINKVECYNIEMNQWTIVHENTPKISGISSCSVGNLLYIVGGFSYDENKKKSDIWCYNIETNEWQVIAKLMAPAMSVPCCVLYMPRKIIQDNSVQ